MLVGKTDEHILNVKQNTTTPNKINIQMEICINNGFGKFSFVLEVGPYSLSLQHKYRKCTSSLGYNIEHHRNLLIELLHGALRVARKDVTKEDCSPSMQQTTRDY